MVSEGAAPTESGGATRASGGVVAAGITMGSRSGGLAGCCAQPPSNSKAPANKYCRVTNAILDPLTELILPGAQDTEHLGRLRERFAGMDLGGSHHRRIIAAQEGIDLNLQVQGRWQRGVALGAHLFHAALVLARGAVVRVHGQGEAQVGRRVFVTAEHPSLPRQVAQLGQRSIHLRRRTLEHSAAAGAEQRVAAKQRPMPPKRDMAYRMPGNLQNLE